MKIVCTIIAAALLCGCVSVGHQLDEAKVDQIKQGVTTREQVLKLVGAPDQTIRDGAGNVTFQYIYTHASATAATYIPVAGAFVGGADVKSQFLSVSFDAAGVVKGVVSTYGTSQMNMGGN